MNQVDAEAVRPACELDRVCPGPKRIDRIRVDVVEVNP